MHISSKSIKKKAIELGFQKVGIARASETNSEKGKLLDWLQKGNHSSMKWMEKRKDERGSIHSYFPDAKTVISVGMNYYVGKDQNDLESDYKFSNYAWGEDYHIILKNHLFSLLNWIRSHVEEIKGVVCVDTSPVMEKVWAQRAGLGWIGKHTNLITKDYGSWIFLGELILDIDLEYDDLFEEDLCGTCTACIESCPTQALDDYKINASKCISYQTIEHRGEFIEGQGDLQGWIYGCDICQEVCPWNMKFSKVTEKSEFQPRKEIFNYANKDREQLSSEKFQKVFKNSAVKRTKYIGLKRNINQN